MRAGTWPLRSSALLAGTLAVGVLTGGSAAFSQEPARAAAPGSPSQPPGTAIPSRPVPGGKPGMVPGQPGTPAGQPGQKNPSDGKKPQADQPDAAKKPDVVTRPDRPESPPDPAELLVRPNSAGRLMLNFVGQPWPDVLRWLRDVSQVSLDWQELPGGYLNLVTHREYTVPEVRNLINRHLLARGYTILLRGELMTVARIDRLNPALVPRVSPADLEQRDDYEFVKVSFPLRWILAEEAVKELKPMLSPNGKLTALKTTNRLEAIDAVINLREIHAVLEQEQSSEGEERLVRQFALKFARAEEVAGQLKELLGLKKEAAPATPQQMMQRMQQVQRMQQANQQGGKPAPAGSKPKVSIVAVPRQNAVLVNAPPDRMAIVEQAIEILDQRSDEGYSGIGALSETEVYRLSHIDPEQFIEMMHDMGAISPRTRIQPDKRRRAVIVTGSRSDHIIVEVLIRKLDSRTRTFHVIPLRKHDAEYVAGSIRFMMGEEKEDSSQPQRRSFFYFPFRRQDNEEFDDGDRFRVDADIEFNRLLLWCNEMERQAVDELLVKLGEIPMPGGNPARRRVLNVDSVENAIDLIERIQQVWPERGRNPLKIAPLPPRPEKQKIDVPATPVSPDQVEPPKPARTSARHHSIPQPIPQPARSPQPAQSIREVVGTLRARDIFETEPTGTSGTDTAAIGASRSSTSAAGAPEAARRETGRADQPDRRAVFRLLEVSQRRLPARDSTEPPGEQAENRAAHGDSSHRDSPPKQPSVRKRLPQNRPAPDTPSASNSGDNSGGQRNSGASSESRAENQEPVAAGAAASGKATEAAARAAAISDERLRRLLEQLRRQNRRTGPQTDTGAEAAGELPPIHVRVGGDGQIHLESDDTAALDLFEELLEEYAPPRRDWHVFELKYPNTWAYGIEVILKDVFAEEIAASEKGGVDYNPFFGFYPRESKDRGPASLSRRKPLKIISDRDSHTILVQGASADQLKTIEDLIAVYDRPTSTEPHSIRRTKVIPIRYSKARTIAEAVKDVYRDLLSENDRALQSGRKEDRERPPEGRYTYIYGSGNEEGDQEQEQPIRFKGLLSIGVDELSNNLVVSASQGLLDNVSLIVQALDEAARPNSSVQVIHLDSRVNARLLRQKLHGIFGPEPPAPQTGQGNQPAQNGQTGQTPQPNRTVQAR